VLYKATGNILHGRVFDENFLMSIASLGAFIIGEYPEAVAVMLFYQAGELLQDLAVNRSRRSIQSLLDIRPDYANLFKDGIESKVSPETVDIGHIIINKNGERVPLDGEIISGATSVDTAALTGESLPRELKEGDIVLSGSVNLNGVIKVKVIKAYGESTASKIIRLVEEASERKAPTENFITKFARYYTPAVVLAAAALSILPPLFTGDPFTLWIGRALVFLVISCPCALVISIPLGFFGGIGAASKRGILVKGSNYLEALNRVKNVIFDKTGTLTKGVFEVVEVNPEGISNEELLRLAAHAEHYSSHPLARATVAAYKGELNYGRISEYVEIAGKGVAATVDNKKILAGNSAFMQDNGIEKKAYSSSSAVIYFAADKKYIGYIALADTVKDGAKDAIISLKESDIRVAMLTGDTESAARSVADNLGIKEYYSGLLPKDKVDKLEEIMKKSEKGVNTAFVGDGINDAPVLAVADIGIAMGGLGSEAAIEAADIVLMNDNPEKISEAISVAHVTRRVVWQNIIFALGVKAVILLLGALGFATMWAAVFADVGVALIAILNSALLGRRKIN
jgi:Cd2+/Zn2+-exporting ATPase